ncbi:LOW QUALITY PROTEIN: phosphatidylinositol phosphatase PTPRQ [Hoplias malabaricus]|uniref:LOW QUALITY PROTEIN: phosphatidylinositol phosphatase PTPRQ n=1 Tax=Hoplias malabaricus TaxID=27720 RepID=UPI0034637202
MKVLSCSGVSGQLSVHVQVEFCRSLNFEPSTYTLLLGNKVLKSNAVCEGVCECVIDSSVPQESEELSFTLQPYRHKQLLESRIFQLVLLQSSFLRVAVSTSSALLTWTEWSKDQALWIYIDQHCWLLSSIQPSHLVTGLQPGTYYGVTVKKITHMSHLNITITQKLQLAIKTAQCPVGWLPVGWSCFQMRFGESLTWNEAQQSCERTAPGVHLANLKTDTEFTSISFHLQSYNHVLLLWTALNDQQYEGDLRWSDNSTYNLSVNVISSLSASQTDCFALQKNATGPGYFLTSFFCYLQLPYICQMELLQDPVAVLQLESVSETEAVLHWSDLSQLLHSATRSQLSLHYEELSGRHVFTPTALTHTQDRVDVHGLSPGHIYYFSLSLKHPNGASQALSLVLITKTKPNPPQNITVTNVTSSQIELCWAAPDVIDNAIFDQYVLHWLDVSSGRVHSLSLNRGNLSAVISQLEAYHEYRITVTSVTKEGIESSEATPLAVITEVSPPCNISASAVGENNLTVCWDTFEDDNIDGFHIQLHTHTSQDQPSEFWVNSSNCITLDMLVPGETYDVSVAAERGGNRSKERAIQQTLKPERVQGAAPYAVDTNSVVLFVQMPSTGVYDGLTVAYGRKSTWIPMSIKSNKVQLWDLRPGMLYEFQLFVTSRGMSSDGFIMIPVRTCLTPPVHVRAGIVTHSSVEVLWDRAEGNGHIYEALCVDCADKILVQKVFQTRALFEDVIPGKLCKISVRTEEESFRDSTAVFLTVRTFPSAVTLWPVQRTQSSLTVGWKEGPGVFDSFLLSIRNSTYYLQASLGASEERFYSFEHLPPGSFYTVQVMSVSGERHSIPSAITVNTLPAPPDDITFIEQEVNAMFITWTRPHGRVDGYRLRYGLATDIPLLHLVDVTGNSARINDLASGNDYKFEIQSFLGSDFSPSVTKNISTSPARLCSLTVSHINSSSATLLWDTSAGHFDFHEVTVSNSSHHWTFRVSTHSKEYTLSGLRDGCSYNATVKRVRNTLKGAAASLTIHTVPAGPEDVAVVSVSPRWFSLRWLPSSGCNQRYLVQINPDHSNITMTTTADGHFQANVSSVSPGTSYSVTVTAVASSGLSSPVSRMITTSISVPPAPSKPEGERVGSNGILLSWRMPPPPDLTIHSFIIRYKEVCPHPDPSFTEITKSLDIPETLLNTLSPGATYNIKVAAVNKAGVGPFSQSLYFKTAEAPPGLVTNLTAYAQNHSTVVVTWFLPVRINGLINKFAIKAKHARTGQIARILELKAEDIMNGALPHCNDAADILSRGTPSPSDSSLMTSAALPSVTLSAIPPASTWSVPISVRMDKLHPYTAYVFEVSAFTSDGEGQIASTMVRMPEAAPEDSPQNLSVWNITSKSLSLFWEPPTIITGRFSYVIQLYGPAGFISENSTSEQIFVYTGLTPYTLYRVVVMAKSAGATGPAAETSISTPSEAPGPVFNLSAVAVNSTSVRLSWGIPKQPNGLITRYRILVLYHELLVQDVTLRRLQQDTNKTGKSGGMLVEGYYDNSSGVLRRYARSTNITMATAQSAITLASSTFQPTWSPSNPSSPGMGKLNTDTANSLPFSHSTDTVGQTLTSRPPATPTSWLTATPDQRSPTPWESITSPVSDLSAMTAGSARTTVLSPAHPQPSTRAADTSVTYQPRPVVTSSIEVLPATEEVGDLSSDHIFYVVRSLRPFTEYNFSVSAYTTVGEGPATVIKEKTTEEVPSSIQDVSYQNISSTSIFVNWSSPLNPNGKITHYTIYLFNVQRHLAQNQRTEDTSIVLTGLDKYTRYYLRVAASTRVGESPLSEEDDVYVLTPEDEPDSPPQDLVVVNTTFSTAIVTWSPPEKPNGIIRQYEVSCTNATYSHTVNTTVPSITLRHLKPYTRYNVTVRAYTQLGHGDQISYTLNMLSGEDVPGSPPYGLVYESISSSEVNVSWSPPVVPNGLILYYSVEYWNTTHTLNVTTHTPFTVLTNLRKYAQYRLSVQAATRVGLGNHSSEVLNITTLEDVPSSPPQFLRARKLSDNQVELSWQHPEEANSEILYYIVRVWNLSSEFVANVTVTSVVVSVDGPGKFNASVSTWTRLGDGGILIYITFSTSESVPSDPPQNVSCVVLSTTSVRLTWSPPTEPNGIIQFYTIYYTDNITLSDQQVEGSLQWAELAGLKAGQEYWVWLRSSTSLGDGGVSSTPLNFTTLEDGQSPHTDGAGQQLLPSGPVRNLSAQLYGSTAVVISWDPPLEPNGKVSYQLSLEEAGITHPFINRTDNRTITTTTSDTIFLFTKLRKYFPYVLHVTPETKAGSAINHTSVLNLRTDDDIPSSAPLLGISRNLSATSVLVTWYAPVEPNGEITEYAVVLNGPRGSNNTYTKETQLILTYLTPYTPYNLSISAVNRKGTGPSLMLALHTDEAGPMSPPQNLSIFNHSSDSVWLQWEPSLEPNGLIQHYGFRIVELTTNIIRYQNSSDTTTHAELSGFKPHSSYEISVCTYTRAGNGDLYSLPVTFTTNESVSEAVGNLSCSGSDWDSVYLEWEPPVNPNGQILQYLIRSKDRTEEVNPPMYPKLITHTLSGLQPNSIYIISVAAVNSAGSGDNANCTAHTPPESVPDPPQSLSVLNITSDSVTLSWLRPVSVPGRLQGYEVHSQRLNRSCEMVEDPSCVESDAVLLVNGTKEEQRVTLLPLLKFRSYRIRVVALTSAGAGDPTEWIYIQTLAGNPDAPPQAVSVVPSSSGMKIEWKEPAIISGPTSYLIDVVALDASGHNISVVRRSGEIRTVVIGNLTAFTQYLVTVTAFTGDVTDAHRDGMASEPILIRTLEEEPKDPPKNLTLTVIPEEVTRIYVTFLPPDEPNGNISAYSVSIYRNGQLDFHIDSVNVIRNPNKTMTAVIEGLKGGANYSIRISAVNGAGPGPSSEVRVTTGIKAPPKPTKRPMVAQNSAGVVMATSKTITVQMPECFFYDDNGPIQKIQVIVSEPAVMNYSNVSNWKSVFLHPPAPYMTDEGFSNPECSERGGRTGSHSTTYVIGADEDCFSEDARTFCNGPLKPKTFYVFKFRATNTQGEYTDSEYSERVRTADDHLLTRDEQIILGVLLSFFLALFLILIIYASVRVHQRKKEGGTYSPREAEIIETKLKLDQLIAVADMELKEEKISRLLSYRKSLKPISKKAFLQHVEDLCANDNAKFQEEFSELPKLLHDLATSDADLPWNRSKNRFTNIKPYNNNRVKLLSEPGIPGSDYINASFVSGYLCPNEFIATQGPLPGTVADFWRMIWETRTKTIAMLTQCFEKGRIRCHQYWPEDNKPVTVFGDIVITKLTEDVHPDWTVRALRVERHGDYMVVHHFNYTSWPEHGVPESSSTLLQFVKAVRSNRGNDNATIVVHCSAGVGRTGVFIALDHLIQHVRDHDFVDVYGLVAELRSERMCMVQNLAQYMFLYQSTLDLLTSKGNSQSIWFVNYSALEKMDSLDAMEGDVELEWEETTM